MATVLDFEEDDDGEEEEQGNNNNIKTNNTINNNSIKGKSLVVDDEICNLRPELRPLGERHRQANDKATKDNDSASVILRRKEMYGNEDEACAGGARSDPKKRGSSSSM